MRVLEAFDLGTLILKSIYKNYGKILEKELGLALKEETLVFYAMKESEVLRFFLIYLGVKKDQKDLLKIAFKMLNGTNDGSCDGPSLARWSVGLTVVLG